MVKIISITNAHQWDNAILSDYVFVKLVEALEYSNFIHTVEWQKDGETFITYIK